MSVACDPERDVGDAVFAGAPSKLVNTLVTGTFKVSQDCSAKELSS